jgi:hypothetical protein
MKATRWEDFLSGSERVIQEKSSTLSSDESLFSRLLKLESRLRADGKVTPDFGVGRRKSSTIKDQCSASSTLSRYIE